jgi:hypothetical protein
MVTCHLLFWGGDIRDSECPALAVITLIPTETCSQISLFLLPSVLDQVLGLSDLQAVSTGVSDAWECAGSQP